MYAARLRQHTTLNKYFEMLFNIDKYLYCINITPYNMNVAYTTRRYWESPVIYIDYTIILLIFIYKYFNKC